MDGYDSKVYEIVDLCAGITFLLDAVTAIYPPGCFGYVSIPGILWFTVSHMHAQFAFLIARLSMKWKEVTVTRMHTDLALDTHIGV